MKQETIDIIYLQIFVKKTKLLVDGCHIDTSTKNLARYLKKFKIPVYGIWGSLRNKKPDKLIKNFKGIFKKIITIKIPNETSAMSSYDLYKIAQTPWEWHEPIMKLAKILGILCFSTPFDNSAVDFLEELNVPAYKIASFENSHLPLFYQS